MLTKGAEPKSRSCLKASPLLRFVQPRVPARVGVAVLNGSDCTPTQIRGQYSVTRPPAESLVSPVCLEGVALAPELVALLPAAEARKGPDGTWFANVPLDPSGALTPVEVSFENGGLTENLEVRWAASNVLDWERERMRLRVGDALRLTVLPKGQEKEDGLGSILINGEILVEQVTEPVPHTFEKAGIYAVEAVYPDSEGEVRRLLRIEVLDAPLPTTVYVSAGQSRELRWERLDTESIVVPDSRLIFRERTAPNETARRFLVGSSHTAGRTVAARLEENGAIYGSSEIVAVDLRSGLESYVRIAERLGDGSHVVEMGVVSKNLPPGFRMKISIVVAGVTFEDGSIVQWLSADDFDANGLAKVRFLKSAGTLTSVCHRIEIFVGDEKIN